MVKEGKIKFPWVEGKLYSHLHPVSTSQGSRRVEADHLQDFFAHMLCTVALARRFFFTSM